MRSGDLDVLDLSAKIALDVMDIFDGVRARVGHEFAQQVTLKFMAAFVAASTVRSLGSQDSSFASLEEQYEITKSNYSLYKLGIQEAIAAGFQAAMSEFVGESVEYYCQIKPVPEVPNKNLN